jgi:hypothetical protein
MNTVKKILLGAALLTLSINVLANDKSGILTNKATATDYYEVQCSKNTAGDTSYLQLSVKDLPPSAAPTISLQVTKGIKALNTSDATDNDATYSPVLKAVWGNGSYFVAVDKNKAGAESYNLNFACMTAANKQSGTAIVVRQNQ